LRAGVAAVGFVFATMGFFDADASWGVAFFMNTGFLVAGFLAGRGFFAGAF
jgi:hypothetical protein